MERQPLPPDKMVFLPVQSYLPSHQYQKTLKPSVSTVHHLFLHCNVEFNQMALNCMVSAVNAVAVVAVERLPLSR